MNGSIFHMPHPSFKPRTLGTVVKIVPTIKLRHPHLVT